MARFQSGKKPPIGGQLEVLKAAHNEAMAANAAGDREEVSFWSCEFWLVTWYISFLLKRFWRWETTGKQWETSNHLLWFYISRWIILVSHIIGLGCFGILHELTFSSWNFGFKNYHLGGFKYFLFSPLLGKDSHFDFHIFHRGWFNHQLAIHIR